ncbi:MAG: histidinol-phosphate transaminase [Tissierellales bacterium]
MSIQFREELANLNPYKPGRPIEDVKREYGLEDVVKLASNENPIGCSPKAIDAIKNSLDLLGLYPDGNCTLLKESLSKKLNIGVNNIILSSGLDEMMDLLAKTFFDKDDEAIMADITFPRYISTTMMMGARPVIVPLTNWTHDLNGMLNAITDKTKVIWLCNPNNPTGTMFTEKELVDFLNKVPENIIVVYDEAYREFVTREDFTKNSLLLLEKYPNLIVLRTFSKIYGLAALRVGYTMASEEIITNINKVRGPFNVNTLAQVAAIAALEDDDFLKKAYDINVEGKEYLYKEFDKLGLEYAPSETNHIFVNTHRNGNEVFVELQKLGVIIRPQIGDWIRVSIGTMDENKIFIEQLKKVLA